MALGSKVVIPTHFSHLPRALFFGASQDNLRLSAVHVPTIKYNFGFKTTHRKGGGGGGCCSYNESCIVYKDLKKKKKMCLM